MRVYRRALRYFQSFWWPTAIGVVATLAAIGFNLLRPWPFKYIVDGILMPDTGAGNAQARAAIARWLGGISPGGQILALCLALVLIGLLWGACNLLANYQFIQVGLRALLKLRTEIYTCLQSLPLKYHDQRRSSDSSFRVAYDSQSIQTIYNKGFATTFTSVITLVSALVVMFRIDWKLTLASLLVLPFVVWAIHHYADRIRNQSRLIQESESDLLAIAQEGLSSIRMVHAFGREAFEVRQFRKRATRSLEASLRLNITSVASTLVVGTLMATGTALLYYVGSVQVLNGQLTLGDLTVFSAYILMLYQPLEQLTYTAWALEGAAAGAQRCFEVLDGQNDVADAPDARDLGKAAGAIRFEGVHFGYGEDREILRGIDLDIAPGETVAFVGGTGAGKSTLLSLVPRFYDPTAGTVRVDGHDLRSLKKKSLRGEIGMVLQETLLFSTTVRENIAYGKPGATEEEIIEAAKRAQAHDFIMAMSAGYETPVGERGGHLSVGQRQRIGIARAFLKDAPILLLDEPTSALDPTTEHSIMETIAELMRGRTTLIITHRLATVHGLGRIVLLKNGVVAEQGTGPELLSRGGPYAELYRAGQYGG